MWLIGATQVVSGVLFLIGRYVPLAIALSGPVIVNIIAYHVTNAAHRRSACGAGDDLLGISVLAVSRFVCTTLGGEGESEVAVGAQSGASLPPLLVEARTYFDGLRVYQA